MPQADESGTDRYTQKMPFTRALIQTEQEDFEELVQASALPSFVSDLSMKWSGRPENRVIVPVLDSEAEVNYYFVCKREDRRRLSALIQGIKTEKNLDREDEV